MSSRIRGGAWLVSVETTTDIVSRPDEHLLVRLLRGLWQACLDGAAMYGASLHGFPMAEHMLFDADSAARAGGSVCEETFHDLDSFRADDEQILD